MNKSDLEKELRHLEQESDIFENQILEDETRLNKMENDSEPSFAVLSFPYSLFSGLIHIGILGFTYGVVENKSWWVIAIVLLITYVLVEMIILTPLVVSITKNRLSENKEKLKELRNKFDDIVNDNLLHEIYPLGMVTTQNIIDKTSAKYVRPKTVQEIMEKEVRKGKFERIALNNGNILYKGKMPVSMENMETVVLEID